MQKRKEKIMSMKIRQLLVFVSLTIQKQYYHQFFRFIYSIGHTIKRCPKNSPLGRFPNKSFQKGHIQGHSTNFIFKVIPKNVIFKCITIIRNYCLVFEI